ncbi:hypothetical protein ACJX0J_037237, partial [Zea mays]
CYSEAYTFIVDGDKGHIEAMKGKYFHDVSINEVVFSSSQDVGRGFKKVQNIPLSAYSKALIKATGKEQYHKNFGCYTFGEHQGWLSLLKMAVEMEKIEGDAADAKRMVNVAFPFSLDVDMTTASKAYSIIDAARGKEQEKIEASNAKGLIEGKTSLVRENFDEVSENFEFVHGDVDGAIKWIEGEETFVSFWMLNFALWFLRSSI